jgi:tetratricopeptide (TPR) repeat protein
LFVRLRQKEEILKVLKQLLNRVVKACSRDLHRDPTPTLSEELLHRPPWLDYDRAQKRNPLFFTRVSNLSRRFKRECWEFFGQALVISLALLSVSGQTGQSVQNQAIALIQTGRAKEAAQLLTDAVRQSKSDVNLWNLLGIADTEAGDLPGATKAFEHGLSIAPNSAELNENLGLLYFRQADYTNARQYLASAVTLGSNKPGVLFSLAAVRLRTGDQAEALRDLVALEPALGNSSEYWEERGRAELLSDAKAAGASFRRALALAPDNVSCLNEAATAAEKEGDDEKALAYLLRARNLAPDDVPTLLHFGSVCIRRDLGLDARDALQKAQRLDPRSNSALYLLARANVSLQNWQKAHDLFSEFSERVPNYAPAYYAMGWLDVRLNRPDDARQELEHALALDARLSGARYELAQLDLNDGQLDRAEKLLRDLLATDPHNAKASLLLGQIVGREGRTEEAQKLFESAVTDDPQLAAAHYQLALLLNRKHDLERAGREREIAAKLNEDAKQASKTQLRLMLPESDNVH